eukprot:2696235-Pleurochrysis_carterae.AAC.2
MTKRYTVATHQPVPNLPPSRPHRAPTWAAWRCRWYGCRCRLPPAGALSRPPARTRAGDTKRYIIREQHNRAQLAQQFPIQQEVVAKRGNAQVTWQVKTVMACNAAIRF